MSGVWRWLTGLGVCAAIAGAVGVLRGRRHRREVELLADRAKRAQTALDAAVRRGEAAVARADNEAAAEVEHATSTGDLVDHINADIRNGD